MIPKKIHYCWFGKNELPTKAKSASQAGKNIAQIMKLLNGMKTIMMYIKMLIRRIHMTTKSSHF